MLYARGVIHHLDVRKSIRATVTANQHRIALSVVPRVLGLRHDLYQPAIAVVRSARGDALRDDRRARVLPKMNHLCSGVGFLRVISQGYRIQLADRVIAHQDARRIFPGDRRSSFHLCPGNLRIATGALTALRHEVEMPPLPVSSPAYQFCTVEY